MADKILVLDDEENYAEMLEALLEQHFFLVDSATKPQLALKALEREGYKLVISDYKMPVMDGADFLQKAREINPDLPFIIVSGLMNTPELVKVANMGVTLVLEKPIDVDNFIAQVRKFAQPVEEESYAKVKRKDESKSTVSTDAGGRRFIKTYPDGLQVLSDRSPLMQFFLQDLWDSMQEQSHVFVATPAGTEVEAILKELARWQKSDLRETLIVEVGAVAADLSGQLERVAASGGNLVAVMGFSGSSLEAQSRLVDLISEAPESLTFVYFLEDDLLTNQAQDGSPQIQEELMALIRESLCRVPPLRHRPADLARYVQQLLPALAKAEGKPDCQTLDPAAAGLLLTHPFPGNFCELIGLLRRALMLEKGQSLTVASLAAVLEADGVKPGEAKFTLEMALRRFQNDLLQEALDQQAGHRDLRSLLGSIGVDDGPTNPAMKPEAMPLLFPELAGNARLT